LVSVFFNFIFSLEEKIFLKNNFIFGHKIAHCLINHSLKIKKNNTPAIPPSAVVINVCIKENPISEAKGAANINLIALVKSTLNNLKKVANFKSGSSMNIKNC
jgi:hypothetical protein